MAQWLEARAGADGTFDLYCVNDDAWTTSKEFVVAEGLTKERAEGLVAADADWGDMMTRKFEEARKAPPPEVGGYDELIRS